MSESIKLSNALQAKLRSDASFFVNEIGKLGSKWSKEEFMERIPKLFRLCAEQLKVKILFSYFCQNSKHFCAKKKLRKKYKNKE